jgi:hypothetical protein
MLRREVFPLWTGELDRTDLQDVKDLCYPVQIENSRLFEFSHAKKPCHQCKAQATQAKAQIALSLTYIQNTTFSCKLARFPCADRIRGDIWLNSIAQVFLWGGQDANNY